MCCLIGMAKQDLEPALRPLPVSVSEERICAVALYVASKDVRAVWIELDFMDFNFKVVSTLQRCVAEATGMETSHVHILTTHNHSGGEPDLQRASKMVLDDFRNGKTGRITLEMPPEGEDESE